VAIDELLGASGARAISRARQIGRMEIATADRILYAMSSNLSIHDLWPDV
jgi:flagellar motor switch protein FliM